MTVLAIVKLLLSFADGLMGYLSAAQQQEAGRALEQSANLKRALDAVRDAQHARDVIGDRLRVDPGWLPNAGDDPNRRD